MSLLDAPRWLQISSVVCISIGPLLLALRADLASPVEGFVYLTLTFPLVLTMFTILYIRGKRAASQESNFQLRVNRLETLKREFRLLMIFLKTASLVGSAAYAWLLFVRFPYKN
jgi:hypothetical protein